MVRPRHPVATRRPRRPADPNDPAYNWDTYDRTVRSRSRTTSTSSSRSSAPRRGRTPPRAGTSRRRAPPDLRELAAAAQKRYSGKFVNADGVTLPKVSAWMAWNEPNNPVFLKPQYRRSGGAWVIQSGRDYARICNAVVQGVKSERGPRRSRAARPAPRQQQPELAPPLRLPGRLPPRDARRRRPRLRRLRAPSVLRLARRDAPDQAAPRRRGQPPTAVTLGNFDVLVKELDRLYGRSMRIWITEYGYQTNPTDKFFGVPYSKQASYLTQASRTPASTRGSTCSSGSCSGTSSGLGAGSRASSRSTASASPASPRSAGPRQG